MDINAWRASECVWNQSHPVEYRKSVSSIRLARKYWLAKPHIEHSLKKALDEYVDAHEHLIDQLAASGVDLHDFLRIITFYFLRENHRDLDALAQALRYPHWEEMVMRISSALEECEQRLLPIWDELRWHVSNDESMESESKKLPDQIGLSDILDVQKSVIDFAKKTNVRKTSFRHALLKSTGMRAHGRPPKERENSVMLQLKILFECATGKPRYDWVACAIDRSAESRLTGADICHSLERFEARHPELFQAAKEDWKRKYTAKYT